MTTMLLTNENTIELECARCGTEITVPVWCQEVRALEYTCPVCERFAPSTSGEPTAEDFGDWSSR